MATLNLELPQGFERSEAVERLERFERADPCDEQSLAVERLEGSERTDPHLELSEAVERLDALLCEGVRPGIGRLHINVHSCTIT